MNVTAKVKLSNKTVSNGETILQFYPDYQDGRNKEWANATPALSLGMTVKNEVADKFEAGKSYTLTFSEEA